MCGFAGVVHFDGTTVEQPVLARMAHAIAHRGPDGEGSYICGQVGFYFKRLAIIDLVSGDQPMTAEDVTIVFNGEIYNYVELREQLRKKGHSFRTTSDTEVILRMYHEYGEACVEQLNGMFAFLLHDRSKNIVLAARDHFGIKPLYFYSDERRMLFASEIKAILAHGDICATVNRTSLNDYLTFQFVIGEETLFQNIGKVLPGFYHVIDLKSRDVRRVRYWEPSFVIDPYHTEEYFLVETRRLLEDSIRIQMRSDVPVGAYLSGGLDSSIVTGFAARAYQGGRFKTFTGAFDEGPQFDERPYAKAVADSVGAEMFTVMPTANDFADVLDKLVYMMDEPVAGPGLFPQYMVSRTAAQHVKVVLGGQGGDEIFGGYTRYLVAYLEQALKGAIFETTEEAEHIVSLKSIIPNLPVLRAYEPMLTQFWRSGIFEPMDRRYFKLVDRSAGALSLFTNDFRAGYESDSAFARFQTVFNHSDTLSYYNKMTHFDMVASLPALMHVEDRASMASSLESRVPLLDRRIVDLVTSMPPKMKFKGGELKYLLKRAAHDVIPEPVMNRKDKMGFPVPLHLWMKDRTRDMVTDTLLSSRARERGIFDTSEIEKLLTNEGAFGRRVWGALSIEMWFRRFVDEN
ncbi:MAG TPA: asparagine synthase (glutamine-hydrolyzing) [Gemmatimonadaceae bacterium]|nr:asparagine synthase (glutamine-hydrolyzing) [Gemmatimonadaceae bacterium]